jgi:hypothetical protein
MHKEREYEKQMSDVRRDITSQFKIIAVDLEQQIESQLQEFETQVYVQLENNIAEARQKTESVMATSHTGIGQVVEIRKELEAIILKIQHAAASTVL